VHVGEGAGGSGVGVTTAPPHPRGVQVGKGAGGVGSDAGGGGVTISPPHPRGVQVGKGTGAGAGSGAGGSGAQPRGVQIVAAEALGVTIPSPRVTTAPMKMPAATSDTSMN